METYAKLLKTIYCRKSGHLSWLSSFILLSIGVTVVGVRADDITATVAKAEAASKPDGTLSHPYSDVNQCPPSTDIVIWPEEWRSIPDIPRVFSVCFVGGQSKNNKGDGLEVRGR